MLSKELCATKMNFKNQLFSISQNAKQRGKRLFGIKDDLLKKTCVASYSSHGVAAFLSLHYSYLVPFAHSLKKIERNAGLKTSKKYCCERAFNIDTYKPWELDAPVPPSIFQIFGHF